MADDPQWSGFLFQGRNAGRRYRMLRLVNRINVTWHGWHLLTPVCLIFGHRRRFDFDLRSMVCGRCGCTASFELISRFEPKDDGR